MNLPKPNRHLSSKLLKRSYAGWSLEPPSINLYILMLIALPSHKTSSNTSCQTSSRILYSNCPSPIFWNGMRKLLSLMMPSFMTKAPLIKMNIPLHHRPWLRCPQNLCTYHPKMRKRNKRRRGLFFRLNTLSPQNRRAGNADTIRTIPITRK